MKVTHGILALLAMIGIAVALLDRVLPHAPHTPAAVVDAAERVSARRAAEGGGFTRPSDGRIHHDAIDTPDAPRSSLAALIVGKGHPCVRVLRAKPVDVGNGIYAIDCTPGRGGPELHYRVDTRFGTVAPA